MAKTKPADSNPVDNHSRHITHVDGSGMHSLTLKDKFVGVGTK